MDFVVDTRSEIYKAGEPDGDGNLKVKIVVSSENPDKQNEVLLLSCFDEDTVNKYISNGGILDYDHYSVRGKTALEKAQAIIGSAKRFYVEQNKPVIEGVLFTKNPYVKDAIMPAITEGGSKVFKSSIGGSILKADKSFNVKHKKVVNQIKKINWEHTAITPSVKAINPDTQIDLIKSIDGMFVSTDKEGKQSFIFDGFSPLAKALEAGYETDSEKLVGGEALIPQDLESAWSAFGFAINYVGATENPSYMGLVTALVNYGLLQENAVKLANFVVEQSDLIAKRFKNIK